MDSHTAFLEKIVEYVKGFKVKDTRKIMSIMRKHASEDCCDLFLPQHGITLGQYVLAYVLNAKRQ
mgnify:CR=1 FL=1